MKPLSPPFVVYCFCAAWCRTCDEYAFVFERLGAEFESQAKFVWVDIEDHADLLGDLDVENFPSLLMADTQQVYFWGSVIPRLDVASKLIRSVIAGNQVALPNTVLQALSCRLRMAL